jgi:hypothetical protein
LPVIADFAAFHRDCEWMGLQRHLKVLGIFARIRHRDGKPGYVEERRAFSLRPPCGRTLSPIGTSRLLDRLARHAPTAGCDR